MTLTELLQQLRTAPDQVQFSHVITVIDKNYDYSPQLFSNGQGEDTIINAAGSNEGSCKIFAFATLQQLEPAQTLACFGDYYRQDVLEHPHNTDHGNIRRFMRDGWDGISFEGMPLKAKG